MDDPDAYERYGKIPTPVNTPDAAGIRAALQKKSPVLISRRNHGDEPGAKPWSNPSACSGIVAVPLSFALGIIQPTDIPALRLQYLRFIKM